MSLEERAEELDKLHGEAFINALMKFAVAVQTEALRDILTKHEYMNGACLCREFKLPPYGEKELNEFRAQAGDWMADIRWSYWLAHVIAASISQAFHLATKEPK